jgi:hypothetical protein
MEFLYNGQSTRDVRLSIILLDWGCRESLHTLDYLNAQSVRRDAYEIIWIEYYGEHLPKLRARLAAARACGDPPPVDVYAVLGMPRTAYYHKHLMYNAGIMLARGEIVCICDSDAIMRPSFVSAILEQFERNRGIVLHLDEVRNNDRRFHPFAYPALDEVVGPGCANWLNGRPLGLSDRSDPLHTRNYGACMCARREDLVAIGGADMHMDYLGHICGPYELTFRLVNAEKQEIWHPDEWIYHVWHPGQAGDLNYAGPHDGRHMSTTALEARKTGRVEPLCPHPGILKLRRSTGLTDRFQSTDWVDPSWVRAWDSAALRGESRTYRLGTHAISLLEGEGPRTACGDRGTSICDRRLGKVARLRLIPVVLGLLSSQLKVKREAAKVRLRPPGVIAFAHEPFRKVRALYGFIRRMLKYNKHLVKVCWLHLTYVASQGCSEVVLYGGRDACRLLGALAGLAKVRIRAVCPFHGLPDYPAQGAEVWSEEQLAKHEGTMVVASFVNSAEHMRHLLRLGFERNRIIVLE